MCSLAVSHLPATGPVGRTGALMPPGRVWGFHGANAARPRDSTGEAGQQEAQPGRHLKVEGDFKAS